WDIDALHVLLSEIVPRDAHVEDFEVRHTFPRIGPKVMLLSARRIDARDGRSAMILLAIEDITARRWAEDQAAAYAVELERSNRELQEFASVASHDLQEPLRKILTFGDRLGAVCGGSLDATGRDYLGRMMGAAERMRVLINDLLAFARVATAA